MMMRFGVFAVVACAVAGVADVARGDLVLMRGSAVVTDGVPGLGGALAVDDTVLFEVLYDDETPNTSPANGIGQHVDAIVSFRAWSQGFLVESTVGRIDSVAGAVYAFYSDPSRGEINSAGSALPVIEMTVGLQGFSPVLQFGELPGEGTVLQLGDSPPSRLAFGFDVAGQTQQVLATIDTLVFVPAPGTAGVVALGALMAARRRR